MGVPRLVSADSDSGKLPDVVLSDLGTRFPPAGTSYTKSESDGRFAPIGSAANSVAGLKWIPFGDSLTSPEGGGAPNLGWPVQVGMLSDGQISEVRNAGTPGDRVSHLLARLDTDVLSYTPNLVTLWIGTNDIASTGADGTAASYRAGIDTLVQKIRAAGAKVILFTIPPRADTAQASKIAEWNLWLTTYARNTAINLFDAYAVLVDPVTGAYKAGFDSGDGIHISALGHNALATAFVAQYAGRLATGGTLKPRTNVDNTNLLSNGLMLTNVDATPNVPDGWTWRPGTSGAVGTIVQDPDFFSGNAFQVVCNQPSAASELLQNASGNWSIGDVLLMTGKVKVVSASGLSNTNGVRADAYFFSGSPLSAPVARGVRLGGLKGTITKRVTVSPGTTTAQFNIGFSADTTASATYRVGEFAIYNLTRLGLV